MHKVITLIGLITLALITKAQTTTWPDAGKFTVDTLVSKTTCQPLVIAVGGNYELSNMLSDKITGDYGLYGYLRYRPIKFISASAFITQGLLSHPNAGGASGSQEGRVNFYFKHDVHYAAGKKKFGKENGYEYSAPYHYPQANFIGITASISNNKFFHSAVSDTTGKYGSLIRKSDGKILSDSIGLLQLNTQVVGFGFAFSTCNKFKARVKMTMPSGRHKKRIVRKSMSFDGAFEVLTALNIKQNQNIIMINGNQNSTTVNNYDFTNPAIKHFGWRFWACGKINSIMSITMQMGAKPGIKENLTKSESSEFVKTVFQNFYINVGYGFAIGAL